jgi:hypothetical protein
MYRYQTKWAKQLEEAFKKGQTIYVTDTRGNSFSATRWDMHGVYFDDPGNTYTPPEEYHPPCWTGVRVMPHVPYRLPWNFVKEKDGIVFPEDSEV